MNLLQIPILYPEQYQTAAAALGEAWQLLQDAGRQGEANIVLNELRRDYSLSTTAQSLGERMETIRQ